MIRSAGMCSGKNHSLIALLLNIMCAHIKELITTPRVLSINVQITQTESNVMAMNNAYLFIGSFH